MPEKLAKNPLPPVFSRTTNKQEEVKKDLIADLSPFEAEFAKKIERNRIFINKLRNMPEPPVYSQSIL
jgi:hypothetical protein